jgi:hypothetical protein
MVLFSASGTLGETKNRQPIRAAVFNPPAETYLVSFLTTHRREPSFPIKGTLALHCQVARLVFESFLMLLGIVSSRPPKATTIYVIAKITSETSTGSRRMQLAALGAAHQ